LRDGQAGNRLALHRAQLPLGVVPIAIVAVVEGVAAGVPPR
jgi:hypothetical protein